MQSIVSPHGKWAARENDCRYAFVECNILIVGENFTKDIELSYSSRDELGILRTEIENYDAFFHGIWFSSIAEDLDPA